MPPSAHHEDLVRALDQLAEVERSSRMLPHARRPRVLRVDGLRADQAGRWHGRRRTDLPPDSVDDGVDHRSDPWTTRAPVAATTVRVAKFLRADVVQLRAFYPYAPRGPVTVKLAVGVATGRGGLGREIAARQAMAADEVPGPLPLLEQHADHRCSWLVEPLVTGVHPVGDADKTAVAHRVTTDLLTRYRTETVQDRTPVLHPDLLARTTRLLEQPFAVTARPAGEIVDVVGALIEGQRAMPHGWCHGDLVFSNIVVRPDGGCQVVDWEYARQAPLAGDLAKLICAVRDPGRLIDLVLRESGAGDIGDAPDRLPVVSQLVVMVARELSWWESRHEAAVRSHRVRAFQNSTRKRLAVLELLLAHDPVTADG